MINKNYKKIVDFFIYRELTPQGNLVQQEKLKTNYKLYNIINKNKTKKQLNPIRLHLIMKNNIRLILIK